VREKGIAEDCPNMLHSTTKDTYSSEGEPDTWSCQLRRASRTIAPPPTLQLSVAQIEARDLNELLRLAMEAFRSLTIDCYQTDVSFRCLQFVGQY
jgi:hypothetical protein